MTNTKFGSRPYDAKTKLSCQLKFFGAKKQGFISVYAKKPRILVKVKTRINIECNSDNVAYLRDEAERSLLANMNARGVGMYGNLLGFNRTSAAQGAAIAQMQAAQSALQMQSSQFNANHGLCTGLGGLSDQARGIY